MISAPQIENIEIIELLGQGGMSVVYKARQLHLDRIVAVKVLSTMTLSEENSVKRFKNEAKLSSNLEHPNIVKTLAYGTSSDSLPYLVMEFLDGLTLAERLQKQGRLTLLEFKEVFIPILSALTYAHERGLVHRDIKPANIMLCKINADGKQTEPKLLDFGIAQLLAEDNSPSGQLRLTRTNVWLGSPAYMSPEQCRANPADGRSDIYSLACVMYEALTGSPPFCGESELELMHQHSTKEPPGAETLSSQLEIPKQLSAVILAGLAKEASARPQTASDLANRLNSELEKLTLDKVPRLKQPSVYPNRAIVVVALLAVAIAAVGSYVLHKRNSGAAIKIPSTQSKHYSEIQFEKDEQTLRRQLANVEARAGSMSERLLEPLDDLGKLYYDRSQETSHASASEVKTGLIWFVQA